MNVVVIPPIQYFFAASLDDAFKKKFFSSSMSRWEFMDRVTKYNPQLTWKANGTHRGLFDVTLNEDNAFICGIPHNMTIPKYTILKFDSAKMRKLNMTDEHGDTRYTETIDTDDDTHRVLSRGWLPIFKMVEGRGYKIDKRGIE